MMQKTEDEDVGTGTTNRPSPLAGFRAVACFGTGLSAGEKDALVEYLKTRLGNWPI